MPSTKDFPNKLENTYSYHAIDICSGQCDTKPKSKVVSETLRIAIDQSFNKSTIEFGNINTSIKLVCYIWWVTLKKILELVVRMIKFQPDRVVDLHCLVLIIVQKIWTVWMDIIVHILNVMVQKNNRMPLFQLVDELVL